MSPHLGPYCPFSLSNSRCERVSQTQASPNKWKNWKRRSHASYFPGILGSQRHTYSCRWEGSCWHAESCRCVCELPLTTKSFSPETPALSLLLPCHWSLCLGLSALLVHVSTPPWDMGRASWRWYMQLFLLWTYGFLLFFSSTSHTFPCREGSLLPSIAV